jgi:resuscitation-promoting factor RpfA
MARRTTRHDTPAHGAGRVGVLALLVLAMAGAIATLGARAAEALSALPSTRVETYLELPVLAGGALAAAWVGSSALLALVCVAARSAGRTWSRGERLVARHAPAVVRRAARIGVSVSVGAGLVLAGGTAHAAEPEPPGTASEVVAVDLGWQPSAPQDAPRTSVGPGTPENVGATLAPGGAATPGTADGTTSEDGPTSAAPEATLEDTAAQVPTGKHADKETAVPTGPPPSAVAAPDHGTAPPTPPGPAEQASPAEQDAIAAPSTTAGPGVDAPAALRTAERDAALTVTRDVPRPTSEVVVLRGDTLWAIAARALPTDASDADVAAEVQRWHAANAAVIGADPDLIRPGQVLVAPTA